MAGAAIKARPALAAPVTNRRRVRRLGKARIGIMGLGMPFSMDQYWRSFVTLWTKPVRWI
jgi:hypothetical protein